MGIDISLRNERGEIQGAEILSPPGILHHILPVITDDSYCCLRFIDWHGYTVFNNLQMPVFLAEWERIVARTQDEFETKHLEEIRELALKCKNGVHLYLWFRGD